MEIVYLSFGIIVPIAIIAAAAVFAILAAKRNAKDKNNKSNKGDYLSPKPDGNKNNPFTDFSGGARPTEKPSPVHANCDHAKAPSPYIDINDTYSMTWDEFKSFSLKLLSAEYPSARISPYKYRGSPDIQLTAGGKEVDVRLIFVRGSADVVEKGDFAAALRDIDVKDEVADWIFTNGRFSLAQKSEAAAKSVALYDGGDMFAMMRRCNISAKEK